MLAGPKDLERKELRRDGEIPGGFNRLGASMYMSIGRTP